ncbi:MAG TPA: cupredoxin family copper-binding protein [Gemmatimonadaceae bacterium]
MFAHPVILALVRASSRRQLVAWLLAGAGLLAREVGAQSLLDRPDNVSADWVGNSGTLYFNFIHRFSSSPPPERKVSNFPTFLIAAGVASRALVGVNYATNSALVPRYPNEYELFARYKLWQQDDGRPLDVGGSVDYNVSVRGVDGELSVARREGPLRLVAVGRVLADTLQGGAAHFAIGGGGTFRLFRYIALAGDAARMTIEGARVVWSAGVHIALPNTPHTLSIHASNANTATLQGLSRGGGVRRYGFEFTIPLTLSRFFHPMAAAPAPAAEAATPRTVNARIDGLAFVPSRIEIVAGTTVQWKNNDPLIHTVTATDSSFASPQFGLDGTYRHTFTTPGTYAYYCTLHPNMKATVVVK